MEPVIFRHRLPIPVAPCACHHILSATASKVKGLKYVELVRSGAGSTNVDIYRDGLLALTTVNEGTQTDNIGKKRGGSYTYQLCEEGSNSLCSNTALVTF